jgi:hypothetical protein
MNDPGYTGDATKANLAIVAAREVIKEFGASTSDKQQAFLMLLPSARLPTARSGRGENGFTLGLNIPVCQCFSPGFSIA